MTLLSALAQHELRRRWRALLGLALLVALAGATVLTAVSGARRGASAVDRLQEDTLPASAVVLPNEPGFDWERIRDLPGVEALTTFAVASFTVDGLPEGAEEVAGFPQPDAEVLRTIERPIVLDGRLLDVGRDDEVVVSQKFVDNVGKGVGDTVVLRLYSPEQVDAANLEGAEVGAPAGPVIEATVVGVIRSPWFADRVDSPLGGLVPSPGLFARHRASFMGYEEATYLNALVRLEEGEAGLAAFKERLATASGRSDIDVWNLAEAADHQRDVTGFEAQGLLAFAVAAAAASAFLIGQAVARYAAESRASLDVLRALGLTPAQMRWVTSLVPTVAAGLGTVLALGAAVVASRWFPIGSAALFEPSPGTHVDATVLAVGALALPALVVASAWASRPAQVGRDVEPTGLGGALARLAAVRSVPVAVGARFALGRGSRHNPVPARPALLGAAVGVAGVVGALTFASGVADATSGYERFGQVNELIAFFGFNSEDFVPAEDTLDAVADDGDVVAAGDARMDVAQAGDDVAISVFTLDPVDEPIDVVVLEGRLPKTASEVALGPRTADALGLEVGDVVELTGTSATEDVTMTGVAFVPAGPHNDYAAGGWMLPPTYERLFDGFKFHFGLVDTTDGADPAAVAERLSGELGMPLELGPVIPPVERAELQQVRAMPLLLAAFLALLAVGAVGHTLASTVRRRRQDLAVLRALGLTRWGTRLAVITQASLIALVGLVLGLPAGILVGRSVWGVVAERTPVAHLPPTAWLVWAAVPLAALVVANLLAVRPASRAASVHVGRALATE